MTWCCRAGTPWCCRASPSRWRWPRPSCCGDEGGAHEQTVDGEQAPAGINLLGRLSHPSPRDRRAQATRIGQWFRSQGLQPRAVRSSPWCRCMDTASLAFGAPAVQAWDALASPAGTKEQAYPAHQAQLRSALAALRGQAGFEVWVTHMFVVNDLVGVSLDSAEGVLLEGVPGPKARALGRWQLAG